MPRLATPRPTPIQAPSIPPLIAEKQGYDRTLHTGTGKTAAFGLPAIEMIDPELEGVQVLALCPTRELAMQAAGRGGKACPVQEGCQGLAAVFGGASMEKQIFQLKKGARLCHRNPRPCDGPPAPAHPASSGNLQMVILDEADEMLNIGLPGG